MFVSGFVNESSVGDASSSCQWKKTNEVATPAVTDIVECVNVA